MTVEEIQQEMERIGWTKESIKAEPTYFHLIELAAHFYALGFNQSLSEFIDSEDLISTIMMQ